MARSLGKSNRGNTEMLTLHASDARHDALFNRNFSIYKKVVELWTLCIVENAIVILSLGGKLFFIGKPGVYPVCRFITFGKSNSNEIDCAKAEEEATLLVHIKETKVQPKKSKVKKIPVQQIINAWMKDEKLEVNKLLDLLNVDELSMLSKIIGDRMKMMGRHINELQVEETASTSIPCKEIYDFVGGSDDNDFYINNIDSPDSK